MNTYRLSEICEINPKKEMLLDTDSWVSFLPMESVSTDGKIDTSKTISISQVKNYSVFKNNDIIFAKITPCMENGKGAIVSNLKNGYGAGSTEFIVLRPNEKVLSKWIYYFLSQKSFRMYCQQNMTGSAGQKRVPAKFLANCEICIPHIEEQQRLISKIEELFSELDNGVETLKKTKQQLAVYRQAVLKEAFCLEEQTVKVSSICTVVRGGSPRPAGDEKYYNGTIPFLKVADLTNSDDMYLSTHTYTIKEAGLKKTRMVPPNTLLLSNSGATLGVPKICTFETTFNDGIAAFLNLEEGREYLPFHYYFWLSKLPEMRAIDQGAAQPNLNTAIIGDVDIPHCNFETQRQVAEWIESRMSVCDNIEKTVDTALQQAEAMQQSILKKAFEGKL